MPKRTDISSILIIGAGPIVIGQACEFDYSGTQACKALRDEGYRVILVNSNPATIMTDPEMADVTYIEPITAAVVERIIAKEKPDALLPTMGGQTALNTAMELSKNGALKRHNVELIGAKVEAIRERGVWVPDAREMQCEAFPLFMERDYVVRVRKWTSDHRPLEIEGYYAIGFGAIQNKCLYLRFT